MCLGSKNTLDMHVCNLGSKNTSQNIYMCVQVAKYLGYALYVIQVANNYLTKYIYVCLGRKIPWICVYTAKIPYKTYICMFRQQDTLDMHVYSKNTSQKYTHVKVAKYLTKKKKKKQNKKKK